MSIEHELGRLHAMLRRNGSDRPYQRSSIFVRSRSHRRILLFADSRGINLPDHFEYRHYSTRLLQRYNVEAYLCPEQWTTIPDFLHLWKLLRQREFDVVILHAGVVDASPRHKTVAINNVYQDKKDIFDEVFGEENMSRHLNSDLGCEYEGDKTINMYSLEMAEDFLLPKLLAIPNLIWIGANKIDVSWRGNYWKDRPSNIRLIEDYSRLFAAHLPNVINLLDLWTMEDVRLYTFDNVHPNREGSDIIYDHLIRQIQAPATQVGG